MAPRSAEQRKADTLGLLVTENDAWVATGDRAGRGHLVPLSFWWHDETLTITTDAGSRTAQNLAGGGSVRLGVGGTRDVVMIEGSVTMHAVADDEAIAEGFAARHFWDPRTEEGHWVFIHVRPTRVQAWREADEIAGRTIMRDSRWIV